MTISLLLSDIEHILFSNLVLEYKSSLVYYKGIISAYASPDYRYVWANVL